MVDTVRAWFTPSGLSRALLSLASRCPMIHPTFIDRFIQHARRRRRCAAASSCSSSPTWCTLGSAPQCETLTASECAFMVYDPADCECAWLASCDFGFERSRAKGLRWYHVHHNATAPDGRTATTPGLPPPVKPPPRQFARGLPTSANHCAPTQGHDGTWRNLCTCNHDPLQASGVDNPGGHLMLFGDSNHRKWLSDMVVADESGAPEPQRRACRVESNVADLPAIGASCFVIGAFHDNRCNGLLGSFYNCEAGGAFAGVSHIRHFGVGTPPFHLSPNHPEAARAGTASGVSTELRLVRAVTSRLPQEQRLTVVFLSSRWDCGRKFDHFGQMADAEWLAEYERNYSTAVGQLKASLPPHASILLHAIHIAQLQPQSSDNWHSARAVACARATNRAVRRVATLLSLKMVDAESILEDWLPQDSLYSRDMFHQSLNASVAMTRRVYEVLGLR
jgi:hypothetical protein